MTATRHQNAEPLAPTHPAWFPAAAGAITLVMWASAFVVIRHVADDISPGSLGAGRLIVAALVVLPLVLRRGWVQPTGREWILLTACGIGYSGGGQGDLVGVLLVVVAAAMYAVGVLSQKSLLRRIPSVQVVLVSFVIGALVCLPFAHDLVSVVTHGGATLWWTVYLGIFPTAIAFTTWAFALAHTDAGKLSLTTFLVPGLTTLIAWALLEEVPPALTFLGGALAIVGVLLTRRTPKV